MSEYNSDFEFKKVSNTELSALDGVVAGTNSANKVLITGANKNIDVLAIADLKLGAGAGTSVTKTAAQINLLVAGTTGGMKIAHGVAAVGAASVDVPTGLTTVTNVIVSMVGDPSLTHMYSTGTIGNQTGQPAAGSIRIKSFKPTSNIDGTPIDATSTFANVAWIAIGT